MNTLFEFNKLFILLKFFFENKKELGISPKIQRGNISSRKVKRESSAFPSKTMAPKKLRKVPMRKT